MKRFFTFVVILVFIFSLGCAEEAPAPKEIEAPEPAPVPEMKQVEDAQEEEAVEEPEEAVETESEYDVAEQEDELAPMGNRLEGTAPEAVDESASAGVLEIALWTNKTLNSTDRTVSQGTTLAFKNYDTKGTHRIAIESGSGFDTERHDSSGILSEGEVWEYTFEDKGTFLARDLFSGAMRLHVTVE